MKKIVVWILRLLFLGVLCTPIFAFIGVIVFEGFACVVQKWFGTEGKKDTLQFLIGITGGVAGLYGLFVLGRRVAAQEKGLVQDRFKAAIDHLSNENSEISRIASFHELFYLARDNKDDYAQTILDVLCTRLRQVTKYKKFSHINLYYNLPEEVHPEEVRILARILFGKKTGKVFDGLRFDLRGTNLAGIDFQGIGKPKKIDFNSAELSHAIFNGANLNGANFYNATLHEAKFVKTKLQSANLREAKLRNADLTGADFSNANMEDANLWYANCSKANFSKATLLSVNFCYADLCKAKKLHAAKLCEAKYSKDPNGEGTKFPKGFDPEKHGMVLFPQVKNNKQSP